MRRLLRLRTWKLQGSSAETAMVLAVATLVIPLLIFASAAWLTFDDTQKQADERIARTLDLLYVNVRTSFETDYLVAAYVAELLEDESDEFVRANERQIHDRLRRLIEMLPQIEDVWVLDPEGRPLVVAKLYPAPSERSFADRKYFIAHREGAQRHVSEALVAPVKNVSFFQYSERRQSGSGAFNGVIAVSVSPNYFLDQFAQASELPNFTAAIVRADGEILVRYPGNPGPSRLGPDSGFMKAAGAAPEVGRYETSSSGFDGQSCVFMYRRLPDLPIYVVHGYATSAIRNAWMDRMASHLIFGIPATLALFGLRQSSRRAGRCTRPKRSRGSAKNRRDARRPKTACVSRRS